MSDLIDPNTTQQVEDVLQNITQDPLSWDYLSNRFLEFLPRLLTAAVVLVVGYLILRWLCSFLKKLLARSKLDPALHGFIVSILQVALWIMLGVIVVTVLVPSAAGSLIALFSVFGLAVSLSVKDSLANLAGGILVLFTKPFSLGDYVSINGNEGSVEEIRLNYTVIRTVDSKLIHIPNGDVSKAQITNYTTSPTRRLDLDFSIGYEDDFQQAERIIQSCLEDNPLALAEPAPVVRMVAHGESAILIGCRVWVENSSYWALKYDLLEEVKRRFDAAGINIPYQQIDVRLHQEK